MPRIILHRSTERLHLQYEDWFREQIFDKERIRWLLLEGHALVILNRPFLNNPLFSYICP